MADPIAPRDGLGPVVDTLKDIQRRLSQLEKPTGTQYANAVANLVKFAQIGKSVQAFTVPSTMSSVASGTIAIPTGYTTAAIFGMVSVGAWNGSTSADYLYVQCLINGTPGSSLPVFAGSSNYGTVGASAVRTLDGLVPGSSISVAVQCAAASGWGANGSNIANIDVIALFSR